MSGAGPGKETQLPTDTLGRPKAWAAKLETEIKDDEAREYLLGFATDSLDDVERKVVPGVEFMLPIIERLLQRAQDVVSKYGPNVRIVGLGCCCPFADRQAFNWAAQIKRRRAAG